MKRVGNLYHRIPTYENLRLAYSKAARGKRRRPDVIAFSQNFEADINKLQNDLLNFTPDVGHYRFFEVFDPKRRSICAASFPERVLHHAVMNLCEPVLDAFAICDSYACRKGKGNRKALDRAQRFSRRFEWYLKLDIRKYFDSVDHTIMMTQLARRFKDKNLLKLFDTLLHTYCTMPGKGLPIGNLISQHLANFYLGGFDHWIKEDLKVQGYLRYMDDFILFGREKPFLKSALKEVRSYLAEKLALDLKEIQLNRCSNGIPFIGYRIFPTHVRLAPNSRKRFIRKFRQYENNRQTGVWSEADLTRHMLPLVDFTKAADAKGFRRNVMARFGVSS